MGSYIDENLKIREGFGFNLFKMQEEATVWVLYWKMLNATVMVQLGFSNVQKGKIRYGWGFNLFEMQK